jgi:hypothetical protein
VIAATGNSASSQAYYPVAYDGVIGVSAVDAQCELADKPYLKNDAFNW